MLCGTPTDVAWRDGRAVAEAGGGLNQAPLSTSASLSVCMLTGTTNSRHGVWGIRKACGPHGLFLRSLLWAWCSEEHSQGNFPKWAGSTLRRWFLSLFPAPGTFSPSLPPGPPSRTPLLSQAFSDPTSFWASSCTDTSPPPFLRTQTLDSSCVVPLHVWLSGFPSTVGGELFEGRIYVHLGFPASSVGKASACNARDLGSMPGWGRSRGEGNGNSLHILAWGIPWTSLVGYSPWGHKESDTTKWLTFYVHLTHFSTEQCQALGKGALIHKSWQTPWMNLWIPAWHVGYSHREGAVRMAPAWLHQPLGSAGGVRTPAEHCPWALGQGTSDKQQLLSLWNAPPAPAATHVAHVCGEGRFLSIHSYTYSPWDENHDT